MKPGPDMFSGVELGELCSVIAWQWVRLNMLSGETVEDALSEHELKLL